MRKREKNEILYLWEGNVQWDDAEKEKKVQRKESAHARKNK